jgi:Asp-tRNA(Asn)/Glu-tRNA(Gln) amidotransferase A subunit family amidase
MSIPMNIENEKMPFSLNINSCYGSDDQLLEFVSKLKISD